MKKTLWIVSILSLIACLFLAQPVKVYAEEVEPEVAEQEEELTFDEFKENAKEWIAEYTGESIAVKIVSWLIDAGVLAALFAVVVKYSKYKHTTTEDLIGIFKNKMGDYFKENFDNLSSIEISKITDKISELENATETIMKVLILAQDNSAKGKAALLEYLGTKTKSTEIKESIEEVNKSLEKAEEIKAEVVDKVSGDYKDIF